LATEQSLRVELPDGQGGVTAEDVPMRSAINEVTRAAYIRDCGTGLGRWNRLIGEAGNDFRFNLPSLRFHRSLGVWAGVHTDPKDARSLTRRGAYGRTIGCLGRGSCICQLLD